MISRLTGERNGETTDEPPRREGSRHQQDGPEEPPVDLDEIFTVLSNRRRRTVLRYLDTEAPQVQLGTLAEHIAAREFEKEPRLLTSQERKRVYIALYQSHLPKMSDMDAITYDKRGGGIERGPNFRFFLAHLPGRERAPMPPIVRPDESR